MTRRAIGGFTLLELLIALSVFALVLLGLRQGAQLGLIAWGAQERRLDASGDLDAVDRTLRGLIKQIEPDDPVANPTIDGDTFRLSFTSMLPLAGQNLISRRADVVLHVDARDRLVLQWRPHLHVQQLGPQTTPTETVLLEGVTRMEFAYWARGAWHDTWKSRLPPALVRISLRFDPGDLRHWPDMVVAPARTGPAG